MLALTMIARAVPDGHTILVSGGTAAAINANLLKAPPIDVGKEIRAVATVNKIPFVVAVDWKVAIKSLPELTETLRKKGDKASYAFSHPFSKVIGESYKLTAGLQTVDVAYKNAIDSINDLASGSIDFAVFDPTMALAQEKGRKASPLLAVSFPVIVSGRPEIFRRSRSTASISTCSDGGRPWCRRRPRTISRRRSIAGSPMPSPIPRPLRS